MVGPDGSRQLAAGRPGSGSMRSLLAAGSVVLLLTATPARSEPPGEGPKAVAVFPVENLSSDSAPVDQIRQGLIERLTRAGVKVLETPALDAFMARHRVRYAAGIDASTGDALRRETGVDGVVIASVDLSSRAAPPKLSLTVRLVSVAAAPVVAWADDAGLAGDDAPGFFELRVVNDYGRLLSRVLDSMADSMVRRLRTPGEPVTPMARSKFRPKMAYRGLRLEPGRSYSVAVVPFFNLSERRNAGEILALLFMRHLSALPQFHVVDTGVTRQQLLDARIIMDGGLSVADAEMVAALTEADFVLGGRVIRYEDYDGPAGRTRVEFSAVLIDRKTRRVVWSSDSDNSGSDGVRWFERGTSKTAHAMATQMVGLTARMIGARGR